MNDMFLKVHLRDSAKLQLNLHTARSQNVRFEPELQIKARNHYSPHKINQQNRMSIDWF